MLAMNEMDHSESQLAVCFESPQTGQNAHFLKHLL